MQSALVAALAEGRPAAMLMGADSPGLPASHMRACLASTADVTLGPTADGGYYAIATRRTHPEMFAGVPWSTGQALKATRAACERCGLSTALGEEYFDVDEPGDLARLTRTAHLPRYTAEWIRTNRQDDRLAALLDSSGL